MHSLNTVFGKNVYYKNRCFCTSSWYLRLYFIFNVFTVVLSWYTNALYLTDSVTTLVQCADRNCKGVISYAETQGSYPSRDKRMLSFKPGMKVTIYAKPTYDIMKLVFGEINGKKGYIPLNMIRETKIVTRNLVSVALPKGISNIVEDNSDDNSDKSTAGLLPLPETFGSTVKQDTVTPTADHENNKEVQKSSNEQKKLPASNDLLKSDNLENIKHTEFNLTSNNVLSENKADFDLSKKGDESDSNKKKIETSTIEEKPDVKSAASDDSLKSDNLENIKHTELNLTSNNDSKPVLSENKIDLDLPKTGDESDSKKKIETKTTEETPKAESAESVTKTNQSEENNDTKNKVGNTQNENEDSTATPQKMEETEYGGVDIEKNNDNEGIPREDEAKIVKQNEPIEKEEKTDIQSESDIEKIENGSETKSVSDVNEKQNTKVINGSNSGHKNAENSVKLDSVKLGNNTTEENVKLKIAKTENKSEKTMSEENETKINETMSAIKTETVINSENNIVTEGSISSIEGDSDNKKNITGSEQVHTTNTEALQDNQSESDVEKSKSWSEIQSVPDVNEQNDLTSEDSGHKNAENSVKLDSGKLGNNATEENVKLKIAKTENKSEKTMSEENETKINENMSAIKTETDMNSDVENNIVAEGSKSSIEGNSENKGIIIGSEQVHATNTEALLGSETLESRHTKYKINLTSVDSESVITTKMVVNDGTESLRPEAVLESSSVHNQYGDNSASASILFTIIPREYIDILRIYVTIFSDMLPDNLKIILTSLRISSHVVVLTFLCGILWLTMYFIGVLFNLFSKDSSLRAELCDFQVKFFKMKKERDSLRSLLQAEEEKCFEFDEKISEKEQKITFLERDFERVKKERVELQEKVIALEADVTRATDAGLEMNAVLSDFLTSQKENVSLNSKVESLQQQITKQEEFISQLRKSYRSTKEENAELKHMQEKASAELERLTHLLDDADNDLKKFQSNNEALKSSNNEMLQQLKELEESKTNLIYELRKLEEEKEERDAHSRQLKEQISSLNSISEAKNSEIKSLREVIRSLKEDTEDNVDDLFDVAKVKTELDVLQKEKSEIELKYENVISEHEKLMETLKSLEESNIKCKENEEKALKEKVDAQNNLEILKNYFAAKEAELQQKVGTLQVTKQQREEDANSLIDRLKFLEEENSAYKSQMEMMKKELIDSDKNWKAQLAKMEKKAHENWVAARNAHREMEALKSDSAVLRQHLSMNAKSTVDGNSSLDDEALPSFLPPPPPFTAFSQFEDKGDTRWEGAPNFISPPPPPPPMPPFGVDLGNMPPMPPSFNSLASHHQSLPHPMGNHPMQWDSPSSRDAFSPISQQSHERRSSRGNSPMHSTISGSSSMRGTMPPISNFAPFPSHQMYAGSAQFSNPASHWTRPNGNVTNNAINKQNHDKKKSRSDSRSSFSNASLHASNV